MCTGVEWVWRCHGCNTVIEKDRASVRGYTCHEATKNNGNGLCRKGVEFSHYDKRSDELCILCEVQSEVDSLSAETCDEAIITPPTVVFEDDDEDTEDGGAPLCESL
ncbi:hypothetical protein F5X96DRAFT_220330 [Biscogniauxia mediterranea]|nr:hypothetical protein F5X96DRAFT_220330 [Biscogniauxia mediterranea]